jgi:hypothetical protein
MDDHPICFWRCPNCGQVHFGDQPPDMCAYCRDFTTWELISGDVSGDAPPSPVNPASPDPADTGQTPEQTAKQKRLFD